MPNHKLKDLKFAGLAPTWGEAQQLSRIVFPEAGMNAEQSYNLRMVRAFLSVLLLTALRRQKPNLQYVRALAMQMDQDPAESTADLVDPEVHETRGALDAIFMSVGSFYCEPIKMLLINLTESNADTLGKKWQTIALAGLV